MDAIARLTASDRCNVLAASPIESAYRAYTVIKRKDKDDYWLNLGACYPHEDGEGFNLLLNALPVDAKLVLRRYKEKPEEQEAEIQKGKRYVKK
jgi:hypothetical protein